jgi:hypothetical protein
MHFTDLRKGRSQSYLLQEAWNKWGETAFLFSVLVYCESSQLREIEQLLLFKWSPAYNYNLSSKGKSTRGNYRDVDAKDTLIKTQNKIWRLVKYANNSII